MWLMIKLQNHASFPLPKLSQMRRKMQCSSKDILRDQREGCLTCKVRCPNGHVLLALVTLHNTVLFSFLSFYILSPSRVINQFLFLFFHILSSSENPRQHLLVNLLLVLTLPQGRPFFFVILFQYCILGILGF